MAERSRSRPPAERVAGILAPTGAAPQHDPAAPAGAVSPPAPAAPPLKGEGKELMTLVQASTGQLNGMYLVLAQAIIAALMEHFSKKGRE